MKKVFLTLLTVLFPIFTFAENLSLSDKVNHLFKEYTGWFNDAIFYKIPFTDTFQVPWVVIILIGGAVYFSIYFKLINFTGFRTAIQVVRGDYEDIENKGADRLYGDVDAEEQQEVIEEVKEEKAEGEVSHFQAL